MFLPGRMAAQVPFNMLITGPESIIEFKLGLYRILCWPDIRPPGIRQIIVPDTWGRIV